MLYGMNVLALTGPGSLNRPEGLPNISQVAERRVDHLEARLEAGKLDTATLEKRLEARFGEAAQGIVSEDGSVDFDALEKLIVQSRSAELQERISARFGDAGDDIVDADGVIDTERLRELFAGERVDRISNWLERQVGEDAVKRVIGEDGKIDFDALRKLIAEARSDRSEKPPLDRISEVRRGDHVGRTIEQLGPPITSDDDTADETKGIFTEKGSVDTEALRKHLTGHEVRLQSGELATPIRYPGPLTTFPPLFDLRA